MDREIDRIIGGFLPSSGETEKGEEQTTSNHKDGLDSNEGTTDDLGISTVSSERQDHRSSTEPIPMGEDQSYPHELFDFRIISDLPDGDPPDSVRSRLTAYRRRRSAPSPLRQHMLPGEGPSPPPLLSRPRSTSLPHSASSSKSLWTPLPPQSDTNSTGSIKKPCIRDEPTLSYARKFQVPAKKDVSATLSAPLLLGGPAREGLSQSADACESGGPERAGLISPPSSPPMEESDTTERRMSGMPDDPAGTIVASVEQQQISETFIDPALLSVKQSPDVGNREDRPEHALKVDPIPKLSCEDETDPTLWAGSLSPGPPVRRRSFRKRKVKSSDAPPEPKKLKLKLNLKNGTRALDEMSVAERMEIAEEHIRTAKQRMVERTRLDPWSDEPPDKKYWKDPNDVWRETLAGSQHDLNCMPIDRDKQRSDELAKALKAIRKKLEILRKAGDELMSQPAKPRSTPKKRVKQRKVIYDWRIKNCGRSVYWLVNSASVRDVITKACKMEKYKGKRSWVNGYEIDMEEDSWALALDKFFDVHPGRFAAWCDWDMPPSDELEAHLETQDGKYLVGRWAGHDSVNYVLGKRCRHDGLQPDENGSVPAELLDQE